MMARGESQRRWQRGVGGLGGQPHLPANRPLSLRCSAPLLLLLLMTLGMASRRSMRTAAPITAAPLPLEPALQVQASLLSTSSMLSRMPQTFLPLVFFRIRNVNKGRTYMKVFVLNTNSYIQDYVSL